MEKRSLTTPDLEVISDRSMAAAIVAELIPELEYAAPVLLERAERGELLVATTSPTDLGFETGAVDSVLLEFFKALVPYVNTVLAWGVLNAIQTWVLSDRESRRHSELVARVDALLRENAKLRECFDRIAEVLARRYGAPVSSNDVSRAIADAAGRVLDSDGARAGS